MKFMVILSLLFSAYAGAETQLACWNKFSKKGARPAVTAEIGKDNSLENIQFNYEEQIFTGYVREEINAHSELSSYLYQPNSESIEPTLIESKRTSYRGNNQYLMKIGAYQYKSRGYNREGSYSAQWILPTRLDNSFLKSFRIRDASERSNSVVILPPPAFSSQGGNNYLRLFCVSR